MKDELFTLLLPKIDSLLVGSRCGGGMGGVVGGVMKTQFLLFVNWQKLIYGCVGLVHGVVVLAGVVEKMMVSDGKRDLLILASPLSRNPSLDEDGGMEGWMDEWRDGVMEWFGRLGGWRLIWHTCWLVGWLSWSDVEEWIGWLMADRLVGWLNYWWRWWLICRLSTDWSDWLVDRWLIDRSIDWLVGWLIDWSIE
jgi:hypothetical protein